MSIGGNIRAILQIKTDTAKNSIGACETEWKNVCDVVGWLDLADGSAKHTTFNAKIQESTHYFLCDFTSFSQTFTDDQGTSEAVTAENARLLIDGLVYEIILIDDPMGLHEHLEIYLKYVGGQ